MGVFNNTLPSYLKTGEFADFGCIQENLRQQFINKHLSGKKLMAMLLIP